MHGNYNSRVNRDGCFHCLTNIHRKGSADGKQCYIYPPEFSHLWHEIGVSSVLDRFAFYHDQIAYPLSFSVLLPGRTPLLEVVGLHRLYGHVIKA